jgi:hypothetical protein
MVELIGFRFLLGRAADLGFGALGGLYWARSRFMCPIMPEVRNPGF